MTGHVNFIRHPLVKYKTLIYILLQDTFAMNGNLRDYGTSIVALLYVEVEELVWAILDQMWASHTIYLRFIIMNGTN